MTNIEEVEQWFGPLDDSHCVDKTSFAPVPLWKRIFRDTIYHLTHNRIACLYFDHDYTSYSYQWNTYIQCRCCGKQMKINAKHSAREFTI